MQRIIGGEEGSQTFMAVRPSLIDVGRIRIVRIMNPTTIILMVDRNTSWKGLIDKVCDVAKSDRK